MVNAVRSFRSRIVTLRNVKCNDGQERELAIVGGRLALLHGTRLPIYRPLNHKGITIDKSERESIKMHLSGIQYGIRLAMVMVGMQEPQPMRIAA